MNVTSITTVIFAPVLRRSIIFRGIDTDEKSEYIPIVLEQTKLLLLQTRSVEWVNAIFEEPQDNMLKLMFPIISVVFNIDLSSDRIVLKFSSRSAAPLSAFIPIIHVPAFVRFSSFVISNVDLCSARTFS